MTQETQDRGAVGIIPGGRLLRWTESAVELEAPAKLNLHLEALRKRDDGYHELESLLVAIDLVDRIALRKSEVDSVRIDEASVDAVDNLVTRAVELVRKASGRSDRVAIEVQKRIPIGAGLGGGSSDAAATIAGLDRLWNLCWPIEKMCELGGRLGSDVPFFFYPPAAMVRGRGERVEPCRSSRPTTLHFVLVCPKAALRTAAVFAALRINEPIQRMEPIAEAVKNGDAVEIGRRLFNRLEDAASSLCPDVARIRAAAGDWECLGHRMTGSGSVYFAVCADAEQAAALAERIDGQGFGRVLIARGSL